MDYDNKVRIVQDFLEEETASLPQDDYYPPYNMQEAFASTRKNAWKNSRPILRRLLVMVLFIVVQFVVVIIFVTKSNNKIQVKVNEFDDLNLRNLLNLVNTTQAQIQDATANKRILESQRDDALEQAERERISALKTLSSLNIKSGAERQRREAIIEANYDKAIASLSKLEEQIEEAEKNIKLYQQQLAQYDSNSVEIASSRRGSLDSERVLHELEKQKLSESYEGKMSDMRDNFNDVHQADLERSEETVQYIISQYDPSFSNDTAVQRLVSKAKNLYDNKYMGSFQNVSSKASKNFVDSVNNQKVYYEELSTINSKFSSMPQKRAIPSFADAMMYIANTAGNDLVNASVDEVNSLLYKNDVLSALNSQYDNLLEMLCVQGGREDNPLHGFVMSVVNKNKISLFVEKSIYMQYKELYDKGYTIPITINIANDKIEGSFLVENNSVFFVPTVPADNEFLDLLSVGAVFAFGTPIPPVENALPNVLYEEQIEEKEEEQMLNEDVSIIETENVN